MYIPNSTFKNMSLNSMYCRMYTNTRAWLSKTDKIGSMQACSCDVRLD